jgi:hypothetical protein
MKAALCRKNLRRYMFRVSSSFIKELLCETCGIGT